MENSRDKNKPDLNIKPAGSYLDDLSNFADLLGTIRSAEKAANELLTETGGAPKTAAGTENDAKAPPVYDLDKLMARLDGLVGLEKVKASVKSLVNLVKVRKLREENGLSVPPLSLHMVFMGNPGTGKTTVARLLSELYAAIGVLSKGHMVEVDRSGLVAGFVGQTAIKTSEAIAKALGGILFIDEAYALVSRDGANDFGHEAIETLLKGMEDHRDDLIVIVAGYEMQMEGFIASNPGLESRFNRYFIFEDYNSDELFAIFQSLCGKNEYALGQDAGDFARSHFSALYMARDDNFGNARDIRNFFENVVSVHSDRVSGLERPTKDELMVFTKEDLQKAAEM